MRLLGTPAVHGARAGRREGGRLSHRFLFAFVLSGTNPSPAAGHSRLKAPRASSRRSSSDSRRRLRRCNPRCLLPSTPSSDGASPRRRMRGFSPLPISGFALELVGAPTPPSAMASTNFPAFQREQDRGRAGALLSLAVALPRGGCSAGARRAPSRTSRRVPTPRQVTNTLGVEALPSWSPDETVSSHRSAILEQGNWDIWVAQIGGTEPLNRTPSSRPSTDHAGGLGLRKLAAATFRRRRRVPASRSSRRRRDRTRRPAVGHPATRWEIDCRP